LVVFEQLDDVFGEESGIDFGREVEEKVAGGGGILFEINFGLESNPVAIIFAHIFGDRKILGVDKIEKWKGNFLIQG
jgi:hypothetical protein